jgi:hypothetical protein
MSKFTLSERQRLERARREFLKAMQGLTERQQLARANALAHGIRQSDPYTRALAKQIIDIAKTNDRIVAKQARVKEIEATDMSGYRPRDPHYKSRLLGEKHDLELEIQADAARAFGIAEDTLERAQQEAVAYFRQEDAKAERARQIMAAVDRLTAEQEQADMDGLSAKGVGFRCLQQGALDTTRSDGKLLLNILGSFAEFEADIWRERQMEGIARAKAAGVYKGRKSYIDAARVKAALAAGEAPTSIARRLGIARSSVYRVASGV